MNKHLYNQLERIEAERVSNGIPDTNMRALRIWLEHSNRPEDYFMCHERNFRVWPVDGYSGDAPSCWLSPTGMIWSVGYACHGDFCSAGDFGDVSQLEAEGWLHVSGGVGYSFMPMTPRQQRVWDSLVERDPRYNLSDRSHHKGSLPTPRDMRYEADRVRAFLKGPISDYDWRDPRWWGEDLPIKDDAHPYQVAASNLAGLNGL